MMGEEHGGVRRGEKREKMHMSNGRKKKKKGETWNGAHQGERAEEVSTIHGWISGRAIRILLLLLSVRVANFGMEMYSLTSCEQVDNGGSCLIDVMYIIVTPPYYLRRSREGLMGVFPLFLSVYTSFFQGPIWLIAASKNRASR